MFNKLTKRLEMQGNALLLRAERQRTLASNIANADTPGYAARDFKFADAMRAMNAQQEAGSNGPSAQLGVRTSDPRHILPESRISPVGELGQRASALAYSLQSQPSLDNNSVDMDRERAALVDNTVRYEATLRFINGQAKTMLGAIQGQ